MQVSVPSRPCVHRLTHFCRGTCVSTSISWPTCCPVFLIWPVRFRPVLPEGLQSPDGGSFEQLVPGRVADRDHRWMLQLALGTDCVELRSYLICCTNRL